MPLSSLGERITLGFACALLILLVISVLAYRNIQALTRTGYWVAHTEQVLTALETLRSQLKDMEASQRGYLLTGNAQFLEPYQTGRTAVPQQVQELRRLTVDNPGQQQRLSELEPLLERRLAFAQQTIDVRDVAGLAAATQLVEEGQGLELSEALGARINTMRQEELRLLEQRRLTAGSSAHATLWAIVIGSVLAVAFVALVGGRIRRDLTRRQQAEAALRQAHNALERCVEERTAELTQANAALQQEIGERRRAEQIRARLANYNRLLLESIGEGVFSIDQTGKCIFLNQRGAAMLGIAPEAALGRIMHDLSHHHRADGTPYAPEDCPIFQSMQAGRGCRIDTDVFWRQQDNTAFPVEYAAYPILEDDTVQGAVVSFTDITARKQTEAALKEARDAAEAANRAKSQFLANMSHELRTPLNAVILYSELLQEEAEDLGAESLIADLGKINAAGKHLLSLINDILDLAKIEADKMEVYLETFDIAAMVQEVMDTIEPLAQKRGNTLTIDCAPDLGSMHGDLTKTRQSLFNLLSNASKFTENGHVELTVRRDTADNRNWVSFRVTDSGIGMTSEQMQKLFQPFTQADASTTRAFGGTGLGLAITWRFSQMLGGTIQVDSTPGQGSTFTLRLPADVPAPEAGAAPDDQDSGADTPSGAALRVLVIDDDAAIRTQLRRDLTRAGFRVLTAASGVEGLRRAQQELPDVITLDVIMPRMDGWAVLAAMKADPRLTDIPVIMLTMVDNQDLGYALGASDYLIKPLDQARLATMLRQYRATRPERLALVVEDDVLTRRLVRDLLEKQGWTVDEAANGRTALASLSKAPPELIMLDLMMPEMDGFEFVEMVREQEEWRTIPIIVLTAKDLSLGERQRLNGAVQKVMQKGTYTRDKLMREVRSLVASCDVRRSRQETPRPEPPLPHPPDTPQEPNV